MMCPVETRNTSHARRACLAKLSLDADAARERLARARRRHAPSIRALHALDAIRARQLHLETGGDPFSRDFTRGLS